MKRLVVGLLVAATACAPFAASAQRREPIGQARNDVDRMEQQQRRADRQERRAARAEARPDAPAPAVDRPRRDRDGNGLPDRRRDRVEVARPDAGIDREPRPDRPNRADRPDRPGQRLQRPEAGEDYGDVADPRVRRSDRADGLRDRRRDGLQLRRDRLDGDGARLRDRDRFDGDRVFDGRSANLYRGGAVWNRGWRGDGRYDWNRYRDRNRGAYRLPRYYAPPGAGYGYRRFGVGFQLSRSLFAQDYWLDDPYAYRLPPAYGPYRWVRYHGDALLVDLRTGRVIDVVYDIFY